MSVWVVVLAGGRGERLRREVNKVYLPIGRLEMLEYPLDTFSRSPRVAGLVVVVRPDDEAHVRELLSEIDLSGKPVRVVAGGSSRHRSEYLGIASLADEVETGRVDWIAVHDGARPFASLDLFHAVLDAASQRGGAIPALAVPAPLYHRDAAGVHLLDTQRVRRAQTPQVFRAAELWDAFRRADDSGFEGVDTSETVERFSGLEVGLVAGDPRNIKVTFVEDLLEAEDLAAFFENGRWKPDASRW